MKNVMTTLALLAASSALASAATVTVDIIGTYDFSLTGSSSNSTYLGSSTNSSGTMGAYINSSSTALTATDIDSSSVTSYAAKMSSTGSYFGYGSEVSGSGLTSGSFPSVTTDSSTATVTTVSRPAYNGTFVALVVTLSDLASYASSASAADDDLWTFSYTTDTESLVVSAWVYGGSSATLASSDASGSFTVSQDATSVILLISSANVGGSTSVTLTATIPEPSAFGLLAGVGTLALVAARRRRTRKA